MKQLPKADFNEHIKGMGEWDSGQRRGGEWVGLI